MNLNLKNLQNTEAASQCTLPDLGWSGIFDLSSNAGSQVNTNPNCNTTVTCRPINEPGLKGGLPVLNTHCHNSFNNLDVPKIYECLSFRLLHPVKNDPSKFGYQLVLNETEEKPRYINTLLNPTTNLTISEFDTLIPESGGIIFSIRTTVSDLHRTIMR